MSRSFAEVIAELPAVAPDDRRNPTITNRHLSPLATVAKHLATTSWKPRMPGATVTDFGARRIEIKDDPDSEARAPWTAAHLQHLFRSPI